MTQSVIPLWHNRIVGRDNVSPVSLTSNPKNWRKHPRAQQAALSELLSTVGWVQDIIVNQRTGQIVDGHLRAALALERGEDAVPVVYVDLAPEEEALVLASLDPIGAMAVTDNDLLAQLLEGIDLGAGALAGVMAGLAKVGVTYTEKIESPVYEPSGPPPAVAALWDNAKAATLSEAIGRVEMPEDVRAFLLAAASRHTVFHFDRIADFYASAAPEVQTLMEDSALVIVDSGRAIENGFLMMHSDIVEAFRGDYPDA